MTTTVDVSPMADVRPTPADVRLLSLTKRFDDVLAVDEIDLGIPTGSFFALLGPSGCGKTTTLRMIGGFEEPTSGSIMLGDRDVAGLPPHKRDVNTVFQSYALFPHLDVFENVAFGLRRRKVARREIGERVREMLRIVGLEGMDRRKPRQLSGGQQQRVALARALVNHPRVLLLDEPLGALDLKLRKQMQLELKRIQHDVGITFVHVTHDQEEAMTMADAIAIMNRGRIEQLGPPEELYERPRTAFVASFLGISNLLPATVVGPEALRLEDGTELRAPVGNRSGRVAAGIRPEKIALGSPHASNTVLQANALRGTIVETAYVGVSTQYVIDTPAGRVSAVVQNTAPRSGALRAGDGVVVSWDPEATFVVDLPEEGTE